MVEEKRTMDNKVVLGLVVLGQKYTLCQYTNTNSFVPLG